MADLSLWSHNSFLSIASEGSMLSIGSVGSFASIASIGSVASMFSIGSSMSMGSALSNMARWSVMSNQSFGASMGSRTRGDLRLLGPAAVVLGIAAVAYAGYLRERGEPDKRRLTHRRKHLQRHEGWVRSG